MIDHLLRMLSYDGWANGRVLESIATLPQPTARIEQLYAHLVASRVRWLGLIDGEDVATMNTWPNWSIDESRERGRQADIAMLQLLQNSDEAALQNRRVGFTNAQGEHLEFAIGDVLIHSLNHSVHHRAQIQSEVRSQGGEPLGLDYIVLCKQEYLQQAQHTQGGQHD